MEKSTAIDDTNEHEPDSHPSSSRSPMNPHLWEINWVRDVFCLSILFPVCLICFSWRWPTIAAWPGVFIPASRRKQVNEVVQKMDKAVGGYFRTRLMIALIMGVMNFITIILVVVVGGAVAGLLGMLLAVPTAACVRICWADVVKPRLMRYAELN